jgi:hypothetical protein
VNDASNLTAAKKIEGVEILNAENLVELVQIQISQRQRLERLRMVVSDRYSRRPNRIS